MTEPEPKNKADGRAKVIAATKEAILTEGVTGASARAIARAGDFNQALIYYYYDSLEKLFLEVIRSESEERLAVFAPQVDAAETLSELVAVAVTMRQCGPETDDDYTASSILVGGWSGSSEFGPEVIEILQPWDDLIASAVRRMIADTAIADVVPVDELAHAMSALFLGLELLSRLDPASDKQDQVFEALGQGAGLLTNLMKAFPPAPS